MLDRVSSSEESSDDDNSLIVRHHAIQDDIIEIHKLVRASGVYNFEGVKIPLVNSGIDYVRFEECLSGYSDENLCKFIKFGWPIGHFGETNCKAKKNHKGALEFPDEVNKYLKSELSLGRIAGPFSVSPYDSAIAISPLNSLPKKGSSDRRVITDLSFPKSLSVNAGINKDRYLGFDIRTRYPSVDDVTALILKKGPGCLLFKRDMRKAFRQIRVDPGDIHLLSFLWDGMIYSDTVLTMGLRSAAYICQRLTNGVTYICRKNGFEIVNYLDDFCGVERPDDAEAVFIRLGSLLTYLGIEEAVNKVARPSSRLAFLGIWFDTIKMTMEVTPARLVEIRELTVHWLNRDFATVKEVQSIIGKLNFVAKCVKPARIFIGRMLNFLREMPKKGKVRISIEFKDDIRWWLRFLPYFNGVSLISSEPWSKPDEVIASDSCLVGCGATCGDEFFHKCFPRVLLDRMLHINALELLALIVALSVWANRLKGKKVTVLCDNSATVWVINTGKTRDTVMQVLVRELCYICATNQFEVFARHIPGVENRIPDMLSRWDISENLKNDFVQNELHNFSKCVTVDDSLFELCVSHW